MSLSRLVECDFDAIVAHFYGERINRLNVMSNLVF